jgi:FkbM family methyltransferase
VIEDLVYDVGMYNGSDTASYLEQGYRVVAIEANPLLVAQARERFAQELGAGRLTLLELAVGSTDGTVPFYLSHGPDPGWSTGDGERAEQLSQRPEVSFEAVQVESRRFERILAEHGVPYYLKIDVEGADLLCIRALEQFRERPAYVSVEIPNRYLQESLALQEFEDLCGLYRLGYERFKIVNQSGVPNHWSGPFGEVVPGAWLSLDAAVLAYRDALREQEHGFWFDLHAALGDGQRRRRIPGPLLAIRRRR